MARPSTIPLNLRRHGEHTQDGSPLVFLHGLLGSGSNWHSHARRLAEGRAVLVPDLRNHGRSGHSPDVSYSAMAADIVALLDREGIERANLVGHSMGGKVAMVSALVAPDRVERLVVVDIAPVTYPSRYQPIFEAMRSLDLDSLADRREADQRLLRRLPDGVLRQFLLQNLQRNERGWSWRINLSALADGEAVLMGFETPVDLEPYRGPTLVIHGAQSDYVLSSHTEAFHRHFPNAEFREIEGAGHWVHAEQPERFLEILSRFIAVV